MIKFTAGDEKGRTVLGIGLSFGNLDRFREHPGDTFIKIDGREVGLPVDVIIFSGETEAELTESVKHLIGPQTKVTVDPRMKS